MPDQGASMMANAAPSGAAGLGLGGPGASLASNFAGAGPPAPPVQQPLGQPPQSAEDAARTGPGSTAQGQSPVTLAAQLSKNPMAMIIAAAIEDARQKHQTQEHGGGGYPAPTSSIL